MASVFLSMRSDICAPLLDVTVMLPCLEKKAFTLTACKSIKFTSGYTLFVTLDGFSPSSATLLCLHHVLT